MHGMSGDGGSRSRRDRSPPKGKIKINKNMKFTNYYIFFLFRNHWIGFQNRKLIAHVGWVCMIFSILTYFIMMFINDAKYFSIRLFVSARKLYRFYYTILLKSSYSEQKGNAKLILLHFWRSRLYSVIPLSRKVKLQFYNYL